MKDLTETKKIVILIDADNAQYSKLKPIIDEISTHGHIVSKRAYGDWSSDYLKNWKTVLNELAIQPIQQFAYTTGKNSTDASMIIDAMDLLYSRKYDAFAIISSDSDFTKLASRLREEEIFVFGVGEHKTPVSFKNACDDFILTENLDNGDQEENKELGKKKKKSAKTHKDPSELVPILIKIWEKYQDDEGWANVSPVGNFIKRSTPDFDPRTYGKTKLPDLIETIDSFEMKTFPGKGTVNIRAYRPIGKQND